MKRSVSRAFEVDIQISGDTWKDVLRELRELATHIPEHGTACTTVAGGYSSGHVVEIQVDESITHESWEQALEAYLEELRARDAKEPA